MFIICELETWSKDLNTDFTLGDCLLGAVKLAKNAVKILVLGEDPTDGLLNQERKFVYVYTSMEAKVLLYANGKKIYQFKAKDSVIEPYSLWLGNNSKYFTVENTKKQIIWTR